MSSITTVREFQGGFWAILLKDGRALPQIQIRSELESNAEFQALALAGQFGATFVPKDRNFISVKKKESVLGTYYYVAEGSVAGSVRLFAGFTVRKVAELYAQVAARWSGLVYVPNYYRPDPLVQLPPLLLQQSYLESQRRDRAAYSWEG